MKLSQGVWQEQTMNTKTPSNPAFETMLTELAALGMRAGRVVVRVMEIEQAVIEVAAAWLPGVGVAPASLADAVAGGQEADAVAAVMSQAVPRVEGLARAYDRVSRSVRRTVALARRMEAGWPRAGVDDRRAMVRRQVARGVAEVISRESDGATAERLFDDLAERLDDPGLEAEIASLPVEVVVRRVCRDLGLVVDELETEGVKGTTVLLRGVGQSLTPDLPLDGFDTG